MRSDGIRLTVVLANNDREPPLQGMAQHRVCEGRKITFGKLSYIYSGYIYFIVTHLPPFALAALQNCLLGR
jgi:hypothetical protein